MIELKFASEKPKIASAKLAKTNAPNSIAIVSLTSDMIRHGLQEIFAQLLAIKSAALKTQCVSTIAAMSSMYASKFLEVMRLTTNSVFPRGFNAIRNAKFDAMMEHAKTTAALSTTLAHQYLDQGHAGTIATNAL